MNNIGNPDLARAQAGETEKDARPPSPAQKWVVVKSSGSSGIGDKLLAVVSGIAYARLSGRRLCVDWNDPQYGDGQRNYFPELFRLERLDASAERPLRGSVRPSVWQNRLHLNWNQLYAACGDAPWNRSEAIREFSFDQGVLDWPEDICVLWDFDQFDKMAPRLHRLDPAWTPETPVECLRASILKRHVVPAPDVTAALAPYEERLARLRPFVGVHVRAAEDNFSTRSAPLALDYLRATASVLRRRRARGIFLATDNRNVQDLFARRFGSERVIWTQKWLPASGTPLLDPNNGCPDRMRAAKDALADILLLASADYLVTMSNSSFSMLARLFSNAPTARNVVLFHRAPLWRRVARGIARRVRRS